uniref:UDP-glucuronosyltransferase 1-2 n=1 Tax=Lygus hesperus TaxID=30085 RepID=A0A0A9VR56_LYGHE
MLLSVAGVLVLSVVLLHTTDAADILGFFPFHGPSHNLVFMSLMEELAKRGHNVTVAGYYEPKTPRPNFKSILFKLKPGTPLKGFLDAKDYENSNHMTTMYLINDIFSNYEDLIPLNNYNQILEGKYDLVVLEYFETDLFLGYASKIGAPYILFHSSEAIPWHRIKMGDSIAPNIIPNVFGQRDSRMDFMGRFMNTVELIQMMFYYRTVLVPSAQKLADKHLGPQPPLEEWTTNASLYLSNTHCSIFGSRPMNPSTIEVGGLNVPPVKPLGKDLKTLLDGAKNGVVYFSMGSVLKGSSMSADKRDAILKVFSELKETVLWKWEDELPYKPPNLHTSPWFPQRDIFAHPNIVLYIGHCGLLGIHEAVTEALPIICLPMFGDQHFNAAALKQNGMGLWLNYADINEELFRNTITQVLHNSSFKENAKRISAAFLDRPMSAMDTAVYWTEYVIRHKGAPHLRSPARWMTWYEYYNLDVIAILLAIPLIALILLYKMLVAFIRTLCCRGPGSAQKKVKRS